MQTRFSLPLRLTLSLWVLALSLCMPAGVTQAVVMHPGSPERPIDRDYVGQYRDASGVAVADYWIISARHVDEIATAPREFKLNGQTYTVAEVVPHPNSAVDLVLVRLNQPLPGYYPIYTGTNEAGKEVRVAGFGQGRGVEVAGQGYVWDGLPGNTKRWGANIIDITANSGGAAYLVFDFDLNGVCGEAGLALFDSGGGTFIYDPAAKVWKLAGIHRGVDVNGSTYYNRNGVADRSYDVRLSSYASWIYSVIPQPVAQSRVNWADFDHDGDVDQSDFGRFQACYSDASAPMDACCQEADLNGDAVVNHDDFVIFQGCVSGPGVAADANCLP